MKELIIYNIIAAALAGAVLIPLAAATNTGFKNDKEEIYHAARQGGEELRAIMAEGISINTIDDQGKTALMDAADNNEEKIVQILISNGANVNMQDEKGETALMLAAEDGSTNIVCLLLDADADPKIRDRKGETALQKAENAGHSDTAGFIGRAGNN